MEYELNEETGKYKCLYCYKEYVKNGIGSHIWRSHGEGINFKSNNEGYSTGGRQGWSKGKTKFDNPNLASKRRFSLEEVYAGKYPNYQTSKLKLNMLESGHIENICEICGQGDTWNGITLVLQLDHINGENSDHSRENLRMVCPNCHTQTLTYAGKNKIKSK